QQRAELRSDLSFEQPESENQVAPQHSPQHSPLIFVGQNLKLGRRLDLDLLNVRVSPGSGFILLGRSVLDPVRRDDERSSVVLKKPLALHWEFEVLRRRLRRQECQRKSHKNQSIHLSSSMDTPSKAGRQLPPISMKSHSPFSNFKQGEARFSYCLEMENVELRMENGSASQHTPNYASENSHPLTPSALASLLTSNPFQIS